VARRSLKRVGLAAFLTLMAVGTTLWLRRPKNPTESPRDVPAELRAPEGVRVRVQVVNSTTTRGLARRATMVLRDRGFDVVETGTASEQLDSTLVLDRSGHPDWAKRVAAALGGARVEARLDSSRYLDVTVLLGRSWHPPAQPFYP
jgi:hypothetical protein